jgi:hypothetical protein
MAEGTIAALTLFAKIAFAIAAVATTIMNLTKASPRLNSLNLYPVGCFPIHAMLLLPFLLFMVGKELASIEYFLV